MILCAALPILCPQGFSPWLIIKPLRETWLSTSWMSSGESIAWCHCDSRWISKPILIMHQGNRDRNRCNMILGGYSQKKKKRPETLLLNYFNVSFSYLEDSFTHSAEITSHVVECQITEQVFLSGRWHKCCFDNHLLSLRITTPFYHLILTLNKHISSDYLKLPFLHQSVSSRTLQSSATANTRVQASHSIVFHKLWQAFSCVRQCLPKPYLWLLTFLL